VHEAPDPVAGQAADQADQPQPERGADGHDEGEDHQVDTVHPPEDEGLRAVPEDVEHGLDESEAGERRQLEQPAGLGPDPAPLTRRQPIASRSLHRRRASGT